MPALRKLVEITVTKISSSKTSSGPETDRARTPHRHVHGAYLGDVDLKSRG